MQTMRELNKKGFITDSTMQDMEKLNSSLSSEEVLRKLMQPEKYDGNVFGKHNNKKSQQTKNQKKRSRKAQRKARKVTA